MAPDRKQINTFMCLFSVASHKYKYAFLNLTRGTVQSYDKLTVQKLFKEAKNLSIQKTRNIYLFVSLLNPCHLIPKHNFHMGIKMLKLQLKLKS